LEAWARTHGVHFESREELTRAPQVMALYEAFFGDLNAELAPFERIKRIALLARELESAAGEITPSMKVRRNVIATTFATLIDTLYAEPTAPGIGCPPTAGPSPAEPAPASTAARA
jgi:long-chain acyl-CoA synthetase